MHAGLFSRLSFRDHEARPGALLRALTVLGATRVLQIFDRSKKTSDRSAPAIATPEGRKKASARADPATDRRIAGRALEDREATCRARMDAAARRRRDGAFLQQRIAIERTGGARRGRCRSLHRVGARFWKRSERTRLSNRRARAGSDFKISQPRECPLRSALH